MIATSGYFGGMGSAAKRVWRAVPHDGGTGAQDRRGGLPPAGCECRVEWLPSRDDLRAHPEIPAAAVVRGRLIVAHVVGQDGKRFKLYLFTSGEEPRGMGGRIQTAVAWGGAGQTPEPNPPAILSASRLGERVDVSQTPA